jgi:hypothetical protein
MNAVADVGTNLADGANTLATHASTFMEDSNGAKGRPPRWHLSSTSWRGRMPRTAADTPAAAGAKPIISGIVSNHLNGGSDAIQRQRKKN